VQEYRPDLTRGFFLERNCKAWCLRNTSRCWERCHGTSDRNLGPSAVWFEDRRQAAISIVQAVDDVATWHIGEFGCCGPGPRMGSWPWVQDAGWRATPHSSGTLPHRGP